MALKKFPGDWIGPLAGAMVLVALAWRITVGISLSDESYYAIFVDDWLKGGIRSSLFLSLHQTAALLVYLPARAYFAIRGSEAGLILFLRALYLLGAAVAAAATFCFLRRLSWRASAWGGAIAVLAFVPFNLPAPSYNTLGMQAWLVAIAAFGCGFLDDGRARAIRWLVLSSAVLAVMTVAYPPLVILLVVAGSAIAIAPPRSHRDRLAIYAALTIAGQALAWTMVVATLGWDRLVESVRLMSALNDVDGMQRKATFVLQLFMAHRRFAIACLVAAAIGLRREKDSSVRSVIVAALILFAFASAPTLYTASHDIVLLLALSGLFLLAGFTATASGRDRVVAIAYFASMAAAAVTMLAATHSLLNFCIGGFPAAIIALTAASNGARSRAVAARTAVAAAALLAVSLTHYYGERPGDGRERERIDWGVFAGLAAHPDDAALLALVRDRVAPLVGPERSAAIIGSYPGLLLATPARTWMPVPYPLSALAKPEGAATVRAFYDDHPPALVLELRSGNTEVLNPMEPHFAERYQAGETFVVPDGTLTVFLRRPGILRKELTDVSRVTPPATARP